MTDEEKVSAVQRFSRAWAAVLQTGGKPSKRIRAEYDRATRILLRGFLGREPKQEELHLVRES